ncbi:3-oxoacyl-[acyl-carrier-protein] synthase III C-terminal domain-containing protein [Xanthomonas sp. WHRI 10064A]|uniref:3-oxoacyl-[acyl-carrier-protein] synthase III C-terminal domain-containing protein n=1 Tax=unclassified Xanthomonas TaxID=2643310 RepID=UPI0028833788|nr:MULTISPECIES: 3-oxoacyl-[acyl-carrier-protein] synthase III C-terminal domain-containing protein [unclassified Xanthomonas]MEA9586322.1 3-oxoacyl-[acyl-carrier-protein] synthase III C-terminal domain-containing protein [Xanthomonas sp. WHRI 10064B]MEA9614750.1 3-oxoacyl-[acyl-carrier-protein] synthase III C-terminal domain-containing protein [Xanthomonas sp. WHRI 10064A]
MLRALFTESSALNALPLRILGTGRHLPAREVTSHALDARWQLPAGTTFARLGVATRHYVGEGETASSMGAAAAQQALANAGIDSSQIDCLISACSVMEQPIPCQAVLIQRALGLGDSGIPAFDVNATCLSFVVALDMAANALALGRYQRVLIVSSEVASAGLDEAVPATAGLFGDGAAAVVVGRSSADDSSALLSSRLSSYGSGADVCRIRGGGTRAPHDQDSAPDASRAFWMDGRSAYRFAARHLPAFWEQLLHDAGITAAQLRYLVPHQASGGGLDHVVRALGLRSDQVVRILHATGNQVAASLPHALHHACVDGQLQRGDVFALLGTGAGLAIGGMVLRY